MNVLKHVATAMNYTGSMRKYFAMCRRRNSFVSDDGHVPPAANEVEELIEYLRSARVSPVIVGSAAVLKHLNLNDQDIDRDFRPTSDLDIFVRSQLPDPPPGWRQDPEAVGVVSWISPSGGYVDFMQGGMEFPSGAKYPTNVAVDEHSLSTSYPVAQVTDLFRLKLNSDRAKDLTDLLALARKVGVPSNLGPLNEAQKQNLEVIKLWLKAKPAGAYGE